MRRETSGTPPTRGVLGSLVIIGGLVGLAILGAIAYVLASGGPDQYPGVLP